MITELPAWNLTVWNHDESWALTSYPGEDPANNEDTWFLIDPGLRLAGSASITWQYPDGGYPGQLDPETATFSLWSVDATYLPAISQGDAFSVELARPTTLDLDPQTAVPYITVEGFAQDPTMRPAVGRLRSGRKRGVLVDVVVTDVRAQLGETLVGATPFPTYQEALDRLLALAQAGGFNLSVLSPYLLTNLLGPVDVDNQPALDLLYAVLNGSPWSEALPVLRGVLKRPIEVDTFGYGTGLGENAWRYPDQEAALFYYLQLLNTVTTVAAQPYRWTVDAGVLHAVPVANPTAISRRLVIPGRAVTLDGISWRKSRADSTNQVRLGGINADGSEASSVAEHADLVERYRPNVRDVASQSLGHYSDGTDALAAVAQTLLPDWDSAKPAWTLPAFTVDLDALTSDELTAIAGKLYPHKVYDPAARASGSFSVDGTTAMDIPVTLLGVDEAYQVTGEPDVHGSLVGGAFTIAGGRLTFTGQLSSRVATTSTDHPTATTGARARAASWAAAQLRGGAVHVDPKLTYRDARLIGV
jgi:hypothetical protein